LSLSLIAPARRTSVNVAANVRNNCTSKHLRRCAVSSAATHTNHEELELCRTPGGLRKTIARAQPQASRWKSTKVGLRAEKRPAMCVQLSMDRRALQSTPGSAQPIPQFRAATHFDTWSLSTLMTCRYRTA
jgi:hypothetical protein